MSVLIEYYNVVIQRDTLERKYPGGLSQYAQDCPTATYCYDDYLTRIGFMAYDDAEAFARRLLRNCHLDAQEIAIVKQLQGILSSRDWLEYARHRDGFEACWLKGTDPTQFAAPAGWSVEKARESRPVLFKADQGEFVRHEKGVDVYRDRNTGELIYVGRVGSDYNPASLTKQEEKRQPSWKRLFGGK